MKYVLIFLLTTILGSGVWFLTPTKQPEQSFGGVSVFQGNQGGTGTSTASLADVGKFLAVNSVNPLTYNFASVSSASSTILSDFNNWSGVNNFTVTTTFGGSIMASGTTGVTPGSGPGTRLMWIPSKAAFRAGVADGTDWDAANIGYSSFAFGEFTKASAADCFAAPYFNICSGARGVALGSGASTAAADSTAIGQNNAIYNTASRTTVVGSANSAYGADNIIVGRFTLTEGVGSVGIGNGSYNLGNYSTVIGLNNSYAPFSKTFNIANTFAVLGGNSVFGTSTIASHVLTVSASSTSGGVFLIKGLASQTGDYFDIQNSDSTSLFKVSTTTFGFNSGFQVKRTYVNATAYTAALTDYYLSASSTSQAVTVTLPSAAAACGVGSQIYVVKDKNGSAGTNNITVARSGSDTIDGATTKVINSAYGSFSFTSDCSANWEVN